MIRIRTVQDAGTPWADDRIAQAQDILRRSFPGWERDAEAMAQWLRDPVRIGYRAALLVAERGSGRVDGFALLLEFPRLAFAFLDYLAVRPGIRGGGLGGALYEAARERCVDTGMKGLFLEAQPDDPDIATDPAHLAQNCKRLRFYEYYGARPIAGTEYHLPLGEPPDRAWLLFDALGHDAPLPRRLAQAVVRKILTVRFAGLTTPGYIRRVVGSFRDDPARLRPPKYVRRRTPPTPQPGPRQRPFALVVNHKHVIHHVRDRGYAERPARVGALMAAMESTGLFEAVKPRRFPESHITAVHDRRFVAFLKSLCRTLPPGRPVYADTFPRREPRRRPKAALADLAGYYCFDSFTPLDDGAYRAARASVDTALTGAAEIMAGTPVAYALCRPPGHHAERALYGGFCYFNNAAIAAHHLAGGGRVATLDLDFHHGNGTQDIFYRRADVLTVSIHGDPETAYPYFSGFKDERGEGEGRGYNRNFPLPQGAGNAGWLAALDRALGAIVRFGPRYLVVCLGLDVLQGDPTGFFALTPDALSQAARRLAALGRPTLVVQEGGYNLRNLKQGAKAFFEGWRKEE